MDRNQNVNDAKNYFFNYSFYFLWIKIKMSIKLKKMNFV